MTATIGVLIQLVVAGVLVFAGAQKLAAPEQFRIALRALGVPGSRLFAIAVPVFEITVAGVVALGNFVPAGAVLVVLLGLAFALAGLKARLTRTNVSCACLGPLSTGTLGWRQVALLPLWIASAVAIVVLPTLGGFAGVLAFIGLVLVAGLVVAAQLIVKIFRLKPAMGRRW
jgi:hypothetical protein